MSDILTAAVLSVPSVASAGYLLRHYPRQTIIIASEGFLYTLPVFAYLTLTLTLVPPTAPFWLRTLTVASYMAVAVAPTPVVAGRIARQLQAAEDAERRKQHGGRAA